MIKLKFSNPTITINGKETIMTITCRLCIANISFAGKIFTHKITLKNNDVYDLNKAKNILQAIIEQKAYIWAKKYIDNQILKFEEIIEVRKAFSEKATRIIEHDNNYINKLML